MPDLSKHPVAKAISARIRSISRRSRIAFGLIAIAGMGVLAYSNDLGQDSFNAQQTANGTQNPIAKLQRGTPRYSTILPKGKSIEQLGGWTRVSPPERDPVFAYVDKIGAVPISVSQQPLPDSFKSNPDGKVRDVALSHSANKTLSAGGIKAYIGTSSSGPQSVIFATDTLLILIKSGATIPDEAWKEYIQSLS